MHFWIDKSKFGSHRCSFRGRHRHRSSIGVHGVRRWRSPKPMVTPVHRFTSTEAVNSNHHHPQNPHQPHSHSDIPSLTAHPPNRTQHTAFVQTELQINDANTINSNNLIPVEDNIRTVFLDHPPQCHRNAYRTNIKIYRIVPSLLVALVLIAYTKFYFDSQRVGYEMLAIIGMLGIFAIIWHTICGDYVFNGNLPSPPSEPSTAQIVSLTSAGGPVEDSVPSINAIIPPPPYQIAILLPTDPKDLPPPSYDNAVAQK